MRCIPASTALALAPLLAACAAGPGTFINRPLEPIGWPDAEQPRISVEFAYHGSDDADRDPGFFTGVKRVIFGLEPVMLRSPYGLTTSADGSTLLVADAAQGAVHLIDLETCEHRVVREGPDGPLRSPIGVAALPDGRFCVSDSTAGRVYVFADDGSPQTALGSSSELGRPTGMAWDPYRSRLLVVDTVGGRVVALDPDDGRVLAESGRPGEDAGDFNRPTNLVVSPDGRVFVTDSMNFRVQVLDPELRPMSAFGIAGDGPGAFSKPKGIALDSAGHVYVVDAMFDNVQVFDQQGQLLIAFAANGSGLGRLLLPSGIHIDAQDRIWVADSGNARVQVFRYHPLPPATLP